MSSVWGNGDDRETSELQLVAEEKQKKWGVFFWFRSGRGCGCGLGPALLRGDLPLCGRASCASCALSCPCGGGAGNGGLVGLVGETEEGFITEMGQRWSKMKGKSGTTDVRGR